MKNFDYGNLFLRWRFQNSHINIFEILVCFKEVTLDKNKTFYDSIDIPIFFDFEQAQSIILKYFIFLNFNSLFLC